MFVIGCDSLSRLVFFFFFHCYRKSLPMQLIESFICSNVHFHCQFLALSLKGIAKFMETSF